MRTPKLFDQSMMKNVVRVSVLGHHERFSNRPCKGRTSDMFTCSLTKVNSECLVSPNRPT